MAGGIRRKSNLPFVNYNEDDKPEVSRCPYCNGKLVATLDEHFFNCQGCGRTGIPNYKIKKESEVDVFVEAASDPFEDSGSGCIMGINEPSKRGKTFKIIRWD